MTECCKCGSALNPAYDPKEFAVDKREAFEYREARLRPGDLVCEMCMHEIMFPNLLKNSDPEDIERLTDFYLE